VPMERSLSVFPRSTAFTLKSCSPHVADPGARNPMTAWPLLAVSLILGSGCREDTRSTPTWRTAAISGESGPARVVLHHDADLPLATGQVVVRGTWGSGAEQFGKRDEASRPGPTSLAVGSTGILHVLDPVNRRIARFDIHGRALASVPIETEAAEDLALTDGAIWVLAYVPGEGAGYRLYQHSEDGTRIGEVELARSIDLVTGLFATGDPAAPDLWVERDHRDQLQVVARGVGLPPAEQRGGALGRTDRSKPGQRFIVARSAPHLASLSQAHPGRFTSTLLEVETHLPLLAVDDWYVSDSQMMLSLVMGVEGTTPNEPWREFQRFVVIQRSGETARSIELAPDRLTDVFRALAVGSDGAIYQLHTTEEGITVLRWDGARRGGAR
jgi:hypothetical protein